MAVEDRECPLCMEPMEADDLSFYPCDCGYQVCRFCWTKIINEENGLCPACRKVYNSEKPALYKPVADHEDAKLRATRKRKEHMKKSRLNSDMLKLLPELRVVQNNLIFVVGLPAWVCKDKEILKGQEYFGRYGKVFKVEINQNQTFGGPQGQPSFSAYITFHRPEDAMRSIRELDQGMLHGRTLRVSLGTTKYCSQFLRGSKCTKHECMYLHTVGDPDASFTKEEMQAGKHTEYMNKLLAQYDASYAAGGAGSATNSSSNHIPVQGDANNSADDHQQPRPRDVLISPRLIAAAGCGELSTSPCPTSSARRPDGGCNILSTSPLKPSAAQSQSRSPDTRLLESGETRKISYPGNRTYSHSATAASQASGSSIQSFTSDCGDKEIAWAQSEALPSSASEISKGSSNRTPQMQQVSADYFNGFVTDVPDDNGAVKERLQSKTTSSSRGTTNRLLGSQRLPPSSCSSSSAQTTTSPSVNIPPQVASWYRVGQQTSECSSSQPLKTSSGYSDESVDLGFDPFQESQQGLAELLAAELSQLSAESENSRPGVGYTAGGVENTGILRTRHTDAFSHSKPLQIYWPPSQVAVPESGENERLDYSISKSQHSYFTSRLYPPPGFERSSHSLSSEAFNNPSYSNSTTTVKGTQASKYQHSSCQMPTQASLAGTESIGQMPEEPGLLNNLPGSCLIDRNINVSFPLGFRSEVSHDKLLNGAVSCEDVENAVGSVGLPLFSETGVNPLRLDARQQQQQEQQQAMANLFATAFNTASAMLNSNRQQQSDDKTPIGGNSSPPPFDLNAFFNQLYRQSPFLFSHSGAVGVGSNNPVTSSYPSSSLFNGTTDWLSDGARGRRDTTFPGGSEHLTSEATSSASFAKGNNRGGGALVSNSIPDSTLHTVLSATTGLIPSMLPFATRTANDYSMNSPLYPPGLVRPTTAVSNPTQVGHNKVVIGNHLEQHQTGNSFSSAANPASSVPSEHGRPVAAPLTWQLDDPAIVTSQLRTNSSSSGTPGWKQPINCGGNNDDDAVTAAASLRQFWQNDPTVHQLFDQHLLQSSLNYATGLHTGNGGSSCQHSPSQQQITSPSAASAIPLNSTANTTETSE